MYFFMTSKHIITLCAVIALLGAFVPFANHAAAGDKIAVVVGSSEPPFEETLAGIQGYLAKQGIAAKYEIYRVEGNSARVAQAIQEIKKSGARLIITLGSAATETATRNIPEIPIVYGLVLRSDIFAQVPNATGVALEFPVETQFNWLKTLLPDAKSIGVIYNPSENKKRVEHAARVAGHLGLHLEAFEVYTPQDIPSALAALSKNVDVLWGIADRLTLSPQLAKHILLFAFRNKIPFIGPSDTWVKAGALYSLGWDYRDMGAQCGIIALSILQGTPPGKIPPAMPRKILYSINLKTAEQLKISIPEDIVLKARDTY
jgi:putative ABC transport system substrate-binding protein